MSIRDFALGPDEGRARASRTITPDPASLRLAAFCPAAGTITVVLRTGRSAVPCPDCQRPTERVQSWYQRTFADLPWQGLAVRFRLHTRRWRCPTPDGGRRIFTERLPGVVAPLARRTVRLADVVDTIACALGGEAGARVLATLGLPVSADTLLNRMRSAAVPAGPAPRVIGIDDWAWRKGNRDGTIIVDLERHRVVAVLADREAETVTSWLRRHPGSTVIARDRGEASIEAATAQALDPATLPLVGPQETPDSSSGPIMRHRPRRRLQQQVEARQRRHARLIERYDAIQR